ncbi:hypothetical protein SAMN04488030_2213 [Aliiroseovarius halocynthiae]|nr:DUF3108 domain-containing protein [Aliiroseovarius halocynthiae]SMR81791.1 hypothetical protein SAMN04488030_2213 [Aliiroseovarius halocynthiae]
MRTFIVLISLLIASPVAADELKFDVRGWGITIGKMVLVDKGADAIGQFRTTGLAGAVAKVRFDMKRSGTTYRAALHTGRRDRTDQVDIPAHDPRLDPLSALMRVLALKDQSAGCAMQAVVFDGIRELVLTLEQAGPLRCRGTLTRRRGYSAVELAEARAFPISVHYENRTGGMVARKARVGTVHGKVSLILRD